MKQMRLDSNSNFSETLQSFKLYLLLTHLKKPHHTIIFHTPHAYLQKQKRLAIQANLFVCDAFLFPYDLTILSDIQSLQRFEMSIAPQRYEF